jgi:transcriptional regulator with XRE-family HTH domain
MGLDPKPFDVAGRLRQLQAWKGLTIQEMADRCGLPKRSLENYMNLKTPQRPGVDALLAVADGMDVSIDWIVGRSGGREVGEVDRRKIGLAMFRLTRDLLRDIEAAQRDTSEPIIRDGRIGAKSIEDFAVETMLHFMSKERLFPADAWDFLASADEALAKAASPD